MSRVLLLNADHSPIKTLAWQRAVSLLVQDRVVLVAQDGERVVRAQHVAVPWPSVVALVRYVHVHQVPALSRDNILARDRWTCVYCGRTEAELGFARRLTLDHVVPKARADHGFVRGLGGERIPVNSWENLVSACSSCNGRKGARTPDEAGMPLRAPPRRPSRRELALAMRPERVPPAWLPWLPSVA